MRAVVDSGFSDVVAIEYEGVEIGLVEGVKATQASLESLNVKGGVQLGAVAKVCWIVVGEEQL